MKLLTFPADKDSRDYSIAEIPAELRDDAEVWRQEMLEKLYTYSNEMMELALAEQPIPAELIRKVLRETTVHMQLQPVLCGSALHGIGVQPVLDAVQYYLPSPLEVPPVEGESVGESSRRSSFASQTSANPSVAWCSKCCRRRQAIFTGFASIRAC